MHHPSESLVAMATIQQKVDSILWLTELKYIICIYHKFQLVHGGWSTPIVWKHCLSVFKRIVSEQMDWKRWFPSMAHKTTRPNTTGRFPLGLCENIIYQEKTADLQTLQHCITKVTATVTKVTFVNTWCKINIISTYVKLTVLTLKLTRR
jgi:hypothetical protein